jgi:hypothetical protein
LNFEFPKGEFRSGTDGLILAIWAFSRGHHTHHARYSNDYDLVGTFSYKKTSYFVLQSYMEYRYIYLLYLLRLGHFIFKD